MYNGPHFFLRIEKSICLNEVSVTVISVIESFHCNIYAYVYREIWTCVLAHFFVSNNFVKNTKLKVSEVTIIVPEGKSPFKEPKREHIF